MRLKLTSILTTLSTAILASAEQGGVCEPAADCITGGGPLCCETLTKASSHTVDPILASLNIIIPLPDVNVALSCTNILPGGTWYVINTLPYPNFRTLCPTNSPNFLTYLSLPFPSISVTVKLCAASKTTSVSHPEL